ncbi:MAG TPA: YetF domain-containing protein [Balneolaceae bacterium]
MDLQWINYSPGMILMVVLSTLGIYAALIAFTRIAGLRSFSKLSSFDFAITVSFGSIIANTLTSGSPIFLQSVVALAALFVLQITVGSLRGKHSLMSKLVDSQPLLLMKGSEMLEKNMNKGDVTYKDILAKLRQANVTNLNQVKAVVMETTGSISVLKHNDPDYKLDSDLLKDVRGWDDSE